MSITWMLLVTIVALACATGIGEPADRLERFRQLAGSRLGPQALTGAEVSDEVIAEIYALVDGEIVESIQSGGPFASRGFLQDRLDAFNQAWGGAAFQLFRPRRGSERGSLAVGAFVLSSGGHGNSVRVYSRRDGARALVRTVLHQGVPEIHDWPSTKGGTPQFAVSWLGAPSGRGSRALRLQVWRQRGDDVTLLWSTAKLYPDGLWASDFAVREGSMFVRHELRYPGWKPGCDGQTEQEDVYRYVPSTEGLRLARRRVFNGWHRELQRTVGRFFKALEDGQRRTLAELVPDPSLRSRLPARLVAEPACELQNPETPGTVVVAATEERASGRAPWSLWWSRTPRGWRLAGAAPVLQ